MFSSFWSGKRVCFVSWCKSSKHPLIREKEKIWIVNESQLESSVYLLIILLLRMFVLLLSCQLLLIVFFWICKMFLFVWILLPQANVPDCSHVFCFIHTWYSNFIWQNFKYVKSFEMIISGTRRLMKVSHQYCIP